MFHGVAGTACKPQGRRRSEDVCVEGYDSEVVRWTVWRIQQRPPWNPFAGLPGDLRATFQRAPLHALLVPRSCIAQEEAMSLFPHWMAAVAQAFSQWIGSWVAGDITTFREWSRVVSAQSWALVRGTMVRSLDGKSDPWLQVYANHPPVGNVMGWPREVLPVL